MSRRWVVVIACCLIGTLSVIAAEGPHRIPLGSIYATNGQEGLKPIGRRDLPALDRIYEARTSKIKAPAVFLVRGAGIASAVEATRLALTSSGPEIDRPVVPEGTVKTAPLWVVVFFGHHGSSPPAWLVRSVEVESGAVHLTYERQKAISDDYHLYFVWVPIGRVEANSYKLELVDGETGKATLTRQYKVEE